jgi:sugar-specific transcriptional regulator TrmB
MFPKISIEFCRGRGVKVQKEDIQTRMQLGCTDTQAKGYITLARLYPSAKVKTIAENSQIPRQEIYRVLTELYEKDLVERIVPLPTEHKAVPLEIGLSILMERRTKERNSLQEKVPNWSLN